MFFQKLKLSYKKDLKISGQMTIIPKPELKGFGGKDSLTIHHDLGWPQVKSL